MYVNTKIEGCRGLSWHDGILMLTLCITLASTGKWVLPEMGRFVYANSTSITLSINLHVVCMYTCIYVCVCIFLRMCVYAAVIQPPKSQVALPGTVVNYICEGESSIDLILNGTIIRDSQARAELLSLGFNFTYTAMGIVGSFNITINSSVLNNGSSVYCVDSTKTHKVYIYTVEGTSRHSEEWG